jgi:hypothetical protein
VTRPGTAAPQRPRLHGCIKPFGRRFDLLEVGRARPDLEPRIVRAGVIVLDPLGLRLALDDLYRETEIAEPVRG